jgi:hypothetical protein
MIVIVNECLKSDYERIFYDINMQRVIITGNGIVYEMTQEGLERH